MKTSATQLVCILGATASGKTRTAVDVARRIGGEIISADSRQVYRRLNIGTGKDIGEYARGGPPVAYHLIDIADPLEEYNLFRYKSDFTAAFDDVRSRGAIPILCGGSGLYLDAVLRNYRLERVPVNDELRSELQNESLNRLTMRLSDRRPLHNTTDTSDRARLIRAIEIAEYEDSEMAVPAPPIAARIFGIRVERVSLRKLIAARLAQRIEQGLIDEVGSLLNDGIPPDRLRRFGLEYRYVTDHIEGNLNLDEMFTRLTTAIRQFAKRQMTWYRKMERSGMRIEWIEADRIAEEIAAYSDPS